MSTAILDISCDGNSLTVEVSEYSEDGGKLINRKVFGSKEEEVRQLKIKGEISITTSIYSYRVSIVVEKFSEAKLKDGVLVIS